MAVELITTKITPKALSSLRFIAGMTGELQYIALERLLKLEEKRLIRLQVRREINELKKEQESNEHQ